MRNSKAAFTVLLLVLFVVTGFVKVQGNPIKFSANDVVNVTYYDAMGGNNRDGWYSGRDVSKIQKFLKRIDSATKFAKLNNGEYTGVLEDYPYITIRLKATVIKISPACKKQVNPNMRAEIFDDRSIISIESGSKIDRYIMFSKDMNTYLTKNAMKEFAIVPNELVKPDKFKCGDVVELSGKGCEADHADIYLSNKVIGSNEEYKIGTVKAKFGVWNWKGLISKSTKTFDGKRIDFKNDKYVVKVVLGSKIYIPQVIVYFKYNSVTDKKITAFLENNALKVTGAPAVFEVNVPSSWEVSLGDYPVGLYWNLANVYSKDIGLDLNLLKGTSVIAWKYDLAEGLPGKGEQKVFKYPSKAIVLMKNDNIVGAWLAFNSQGAGPSLKMKYLEEITGADFKDWVFDIGMFNDAKGNEDLETMNPLEVLNAYFNALDSGNKKRANACLSPGELMDALTVNLWQFGLYNAGFGENNSMEQNIKAAVPYSYGFTDETNKVIEFNAKKLDTYDFSKYNTIEIAVSVNLKWVKNEFSIPDNNGDQIRFAILNKYKNGWKIEGLGTGP